MSVHMLDIATTSARMGSPSPRVATTCSEGMNRLRAEGSVDQGGNGAQMGMGRELGGEKGHEGRARRGNTGPTKWGTKSNRPARG